MARGMVMHGERTQNLFIYKFLYRNLNAECAPKVETHLSSQHISERSQLML